MTQERTEKGERESLGEGERPSERELGESEGESWRGPLGLTLYLLFHIIYVLLGYLCCHVATMLCILDSFVIYMAFLL